jgi:hypothetical protein
MPEEIKCPECMGTRWKISGDKARPCVCLEQDRLDAYLGPDLSSAARIQSSPLYTIDTSFNATVTLDRTSENLFIKSRWHLLLPHLRLAIGHRHHLDQTFRHHILTDERIINVFVGNENYKARSGRGHEGNFNGLKDLVEAQDLVVVRLGFLGYKNIAAPGALKQALMIREAVLKPTWVVQNPDGKLPISWDDEVAAYIHEHFDIIDMTKLPVIEPERPSGMEVEEVESTKTTKRPIIPAPVWHDLVPTHDADPLGVTRADKYKPGRNRFKKRGGGDGDSGGGDLPPI